MRDSLDLIAIERKAWRSTFHDGLWDLYLGWLLVVLGLMTYLNDLGLNLALRYSIPLGLMAIGMVALWLGKRLLTMPRLGKVEFSEVRKDRRGHLRLFLAGLVLLTGVLWLTFGNRSPLPSGGGVRSSWLPAVVWVVLVLAAFSFIANRYDYERFYFIGLLYASAVPLDELLTAITGWDLSILPFAGLGLFLMTLGTARLRQFLQRYPGSMGAAING